MSTAKQSSLPRILGLITAFVGCAVAVVVTASPIALTQSRIIAPQRSANNNSTKRPPVATLRASDSTSGSRVALTSNQSLNDYEAYRRGDRFYVRIPAADVPRPEAVRGRAFADVKVQRGASDTVVSFRMQPGATARVEQRGNKLDVVFTMPGTRPANTTSTGRDVVRNDAGPAPPADPQRRGNTNSNRSDPADRAGNRNSNARSSAASARPTPTPRATPSPKPSPAPSAKPSPSPTAAARVSPFVAQQRSSPSPATTASSQTIPTGRDLTWSNVKQRVRYWILLAQLNPIPVGIGVAVLLLLIGLLIMQRRRNKALRRSRPLKSPKKSAVLATEKVSPIVVEPQPVEPLQSEAQLAGATAAVAAVTTEPPPQPAPPATDAQHERVTRASEEVKTLMAGGDYDKSIIASDDRYTRQLVGAELLSALVGRNLQRRERARAAFMNHGYFDDATRDLRIAESPNERAAAARRLSFVHDREATPHLIAALEDPSPDVRRASVEALMDLRDPAAIAPLNALMQTETDRRVPRSLLKHAVEACATSASEPTSEDLRPPISDLQSSLPQPASTPISQTADTEREVIEI